MAVVTDIFPNFASALAAAGQGYNDSELAEVVAHMTTAVPIDSLQVAPEQAVNSILAVGIAATEAAERPLHVLDLGGGCGFHYLRVSAAIRAPLRWAIGGLVPWLVLAAGQAVWIAFDRRLLWLHLVIAVITVLGVAISLAVVPLWRYRVHRWELGPQAVYTRTGWLVQERRIAPISRVQTVDTYRGPLDRLFGLANVTVTTASSAGAVHIAALDVAVADHLVAQLTDIAAIGGEDAT